MRFGKRLEISCSWPEQGIAFPVSSKKFPVLFRLCKASIVPQLHETQRFSPGCRLRDGCRNAPNSLFFSLLAGNLGRRTVRSRLRPPPRSRFLSFMVNGGVRFIAIILGNGSSGRWQRNRHRSRATMIIPGFRRLFSVRLIRTLVVDLAGPPARRRTSLEQPRRRHGERER